MKPIRRSPGSPLSMCPTPNKKRSAKRLSNFDPASRSPWTKLQEAQKRTAHTRKEMKQTIESAMKLIRTGMILGRRSILMCFFSRVARHAPRMLIQSTPCLNRSSPQTSPVEKKLRKMICKTAKIAREPKRITSNHFSRFSKNWIIPLTYLEKDTVTATPSNWPGIL